MANVYNVVTGINFYITQISTPPCSRPYVLSSSFTEFCPWKLGAWGKGRYDIHTRKWSFNLLRSFSWPTGRFLTISYASGLQRISRTKSRFSQWRPERQLYARCAGTQSHDLIFLIGHLFHSYCMSLSPEDLQHILCTSLMCPCMSPAHLLLHGNVSGQIC